MDDYSLSHVYKYLYSLESTKHGVTYYHREQMCSSYKVLDATHDFPLNYLNMMLPSQCNNSCAAVLGFVHNMSMRLLDALGQRVFVPTQPTPSLKAMMGDSCSSLPENDTILWSSNFQPFYLMAHFTGAKFGRAHHQFLDS